METNVLLKMVDYALAGDQKSLEMAVRKLASSVRGRDDELYLELNRRLRNKAIRSAAFERPPPVDSDTRMNLVRIENPANQEKAPIYSELIRTSLEQVILERSHAELLKQKMLSPTRSLIFDGPPGTGKTMSARWLARQLDLPLLILDLATVISSFLGKTGSNIRMVLDYAAAQPCVLLLDEFDAIAKRRDDHGELGELKRLVTVLLQAIDDWPDSSLLIAATNHGELLDPAIWRRFDVEIKFELPDLRMIEQYLSECWPLHKSKYSAESFKGRSFSFINRELRRAERADVISSLPLEKQVSVITEDKYPELPLAQKKILARKLWESGMSQRAISKKLRMSRPTVKSSIS